MNRSHVVLLLSSLVLLSACSEQMSYSQGVYMLMDTSGTYTRELDKARNIINFTLSRMSPGDSFAVARIDTGSFSEKDLVSKVTFDNRPSTTNQQKLRFREDIDRFIDQVIPSRYTDITGGMLQGIEYLAEAGSGKKTILIFSDLKEELGEGYIRDIPLQLDGVEVIALNVTKLRSDNVDPREYIERLGHWQKRVEAGGGVWKQINDLERLESIFSD